MTIIPLGGAIKLTWDHYHLTEWEIKCQPPVATWYVWIFVAVFIAATIFLLWLGGKMNKAT